MVQMLSLDANNNLHLDDWFTPGNVQYLNGKDLDLGSNGSAF